MYKEEVIKITLEVLKEKRLERTSINQIVKRMKSSPGNLYYHFKNKNEIYKEAVNYSYREITKTLNKVKMQKDKQKNLYNLTRILIRFLEEREEILFFLMSIRSSCYSDRVLETQTLLLKFKELLLTEKTDTELERKVTLKLRMFFGSVYELLYTNRVINKANLSEEEIEEISCFYWEIDMRKKSNIYKQESLKTVLI